MTALFSLENAMAPILAELKVGKKLSFVIKTNLSTIQNALDHGHSRDEIHKLIKTERTCTKDTFFNALYRARKKIKQNNIQPIKTVLIENSIDSKRPSIPKQEQELDYSDWIKSFAFNQNFNHKVLRVTIPDLIKGGWNPENYHILRDKFDILNYQKLSKVMGVMRASNFRKTIYKDGKAYF